MSEPEPEPEPGTSSPRDVHVTLKPAQTRQQRQDVVRTVAAAFRREKQGCGPHYFVWETADGVDGGSAPWEYRKTPQDELPWLHRAAVEELPYSYYSVKSDDEGTVVGGLVMDENSDGVHILELLGTSKGFGLPTVRTLLRRAFDGREHFRVVALEAASALQNQKLKTFYSNTGFIQPSALDRVSRDLPQLATGGTLAFTFFSSTFAHIHSRSRSLTPKASCSAGEDVLCKEDMRRLAKVAKVRLGNRPFFINSQMYNVLHKMTGSKQRTGTAMVRQAQPFHVW